MADGNKKIAFGGSASVAIVADGNHPKIFTAAELLAKAPNLDGAMRILTGERVEVRPGRGEVYVSFNDEKQTAAFDKAKYVSDALNAIKQEVNDSLPQGKKIFESFAQNKGISVSIVPATLNRVMDALAYNNPAKFKLIDLAGIIDDRAKQLRPVQETDDKARGGHVARESQRRIMQVEGLGDTRGF